MHNSSKKTIIVTGANAGIGARPHAAWRNSATRSSWSAAMRGRRSRAAGDRQPDRQPGRHCVNCDLSSQESIRQFAADFMAQYPRLDVLINNAANFDHTLKQPTLTEDGVEVIFATNHLGPFLLTNLLLDVLKASAPARVLTVASKGLMTYPFLSIEFDNLNGQRKFSTQHAYYHSKMAQVMFTFDLAERLHGTGVTVNCLRVPNVQIDKGRYEYLTGWKRSAYEIKRRQGITPAQMAQAYIRLRGRSGIETVTGQYFNEHCQQVKAYKPAYNHAVWKKLWDVSATLSHLDSVQLPG